MHPTDPPSPHSADSERQLATLVELAHLFNSSLDLKVVLNRVMECTKSVMGAEASSLLLLERESGQLQWATATGEVGELVMQTVSHPRGSGIAGWVFDHGEAVRIDDAYEDPRFNPSMDRKTGFRTRSVLCAPLVVRNEVIGVAQTINRKGKDRPGVFTPEDLEFFCRICMSAATAVQNALMHREILRQERQRRDLELAKRIQQSFLPEPPQDLSGFRVSMRNQSALKVGGDFYEFFRVAPEVHFFCIGDVSGKGVPAALLMARLISDLRYVAPEFKDPAHVLSHLNNRLCDQTVTSMFVTLLAGTLDTSNRLLTLACAGHPYPIHIRPGKEAVVFEVSAQPPLGLVKDLPFDHSCLCLEPGESLFLYTDGLIEATNPKRKMLEIEGLASWLSGRHERGVELLDHTFEMVLEHMRGDTTQDDLTALLIDRE